MLTFVTRCPRNRARAVARALRARTEPGCERVEGIFDRASAATKREKRAAEPQRETFHKLRISGGGSKTLTCLS